MSPSWGEGPFIALVGPTASGKTAAALALAEEVPIEVISVDSALVYRGMDIGTAKPTRDERARVPHHLIDILEPTQAYSAADFWRDAHRLAQEIRARGNHPLLVGGTMLYIKALREGIDHLPSAVPEVRAAIEAQAAAEGWPALHAELARVDPATAARLPPHDAQRISRALEVWRVSGKPLSAWFSDTAQRALPGTAVQLVSLEPEQRGWLHERIAQRFAQMMNDGFLEEVRRLRARGDLHPDLPSMRCVGYRQAWHALDQAQSLGVSEASLLPSLVETGVAATRQLAKRQLTWLRGMHDRQGIACDAPDATAQAVRSLRALITARA